MEKIAFRMMSRPGQIAAYRERHAAIWPELAALLKQAGIQDYSIHHDPETGALFATLWRRADHTMDLLPQTELMRRWWRYMAPLMETTAEGAPCSVELETVFHLR